MKVSTRRTPLKPKPQGAPLTAMCEVCFQSYEVRPNGKGRASAAKRLTCYEAACVKARHSLQGARSIASRRRNLAAKRLAMAVTLEAEARR